MGTAPVTSYFCITIVSMSKKGWFYTGFFVCLALAFYAVLAVTIPGFTKRGVPPVSYIRPFQFITQDGLAYTQENVKGKYLSPPTFSLPAKGFVHG